LVGRTDGGSTVSLFGFRNDVLGFDIANFSRCNSPTIQKEVHETLEALLNA